MSISPKLSKIFLINPSVRQKAATFLISLAPQLEKTARGERAEITETEFRKGLYLIDELAVLSKGGLKKSLENMKQDLEDRQWIKQHGIDVM